MSGIGSFEIKRLDRTSSATISPEGTSKPVLIDNIVSDEQYFDGIPTYDARKIKKALEIFRAAGRKYAMPPFVLENNDQVLRVRIMAPLRTESGQPYLFKPPVEQPMKLVKENDNAETISNYRIEYLAFGGIVALLLGKLEIKVSCFETENILQVKTICNA